MKGSLFIVSAPSGAGKTTLCKRLAKATQDIVHSISYTTRTARPAEVHGKDYYFVDDEQFLEMVKRGEFLEWAEVHGNLYGTLKRQILEFLQKGIDVVLDIDIQGAAHIRSQDMEATFIFVLPPSLDVLRQRLKLRKTDSEEDIDRRLRNARKEIADYRQYDYVIVNDRLDVALNELRSIVRSMRIQSGRIDHNWITERFLQNNGVTLEGGE
jgi:guanylate kinase